MRELIDAELDVVGGGLGKPEMLDPWPVGIGGGALFDGVSAGVNAILSAERSIISKLISSPWFGPSSRAHASSARFCQ
jgi:hypothetical protein